MRNSANGTLAPAAIMLLVAASAGTVIWALLLRLVAPLDFQVFYSAGLAVRSHLDPYPAPHSAAVWSGSAFVYPYATTWLFSAMAALSLPAASLLWTLASVAAITAGVWLLVGARWGVLLAVLLASPTLDGLQMGTVNAALFLGLALAWRWRDRVAVVAPAIALLIALKLFLWPLALWLLVTRRWRAAGLAAVVGAAVIGAGFLAGPLEPVTYLRMLAVLGKHEAAQGAGFQGLLIAWGASAGAAQIVGVLSALALMYGISRRTDLASPALYVAAIAAALIASPVIWHHYYLLAAAPLLLVFRPRAAAAWYLLIGWASVAPHPSGGASLIALTIVADAVLAFLVLRWIVLHRSRIGGRDWRGLPVLAWALLAGALIAVPLIRVGARPFIVGLSQAALPVAATVALCLAALMSSRGAVSRGPLATGAVPLSRRPGQHR